MSLESESELATTGCREQGVHKGLGNEEDFIESISFVNKIKGFPYRLHALLSQPYIQDVMCWTPSGDAFCILNQDLFVEFVLHKYFHNVKFESFARKMRRWGFKKVDGDRRAPKSKGVAVFQCQYFQRDKPDLCKFMCDERKLKKKSSGENKSKVSHVKSPKKNVRGGFRDIDNSGEFRLPLESFCKPNPASTLSKSVLSESISVTNFQSKRLFQQQGALSGTARNPCQERTQHKFPSRECQFVSSGGTFPTTSTTAVRATTLDSRNSAPSQISATSFSASDGSKQAIVQTRQSNNEMLLSYSDKIPSSLPNYRTLFAERSHRHLPSNRGVVTFFTAHSYRYNLHSEEKKERNRNYARVTMKDCEEELALVRQLRILKEKRLILERICSLGQFHGLESSRLGISKDIEY